MKKYISNRTLVLVIFLLVFANAFAQSNESHNSLLWRITGNGLLKTSYLFGTMHVTDKRVFFFGDSLYKSLEQCEGFAAELDMSTFASDYLNQMMDADNDKKILLKDRLSKVILNRYKVRLEKKFKKNLDKITIDDIEKAEQDLRRDILKKGEMPTFMDAYLFDIAKRQGKWVGGIEDMEDQNEMKSAGTIEEKLEIIFTSKKNIDSTLDWMIKTYIAEDIGSIDRHEGIWLGNRDYILNKRNIKMSRRIDSIARLRSCLFAIGAAHVPGDSGVVSKLRKLGYVVTPVISSKKIDPATYSFKEVDIKWTDVVIKDSLYKLEMPGIPQNINKQENMGIEMKMHFDMGSMRAFFTLHIPVTNNTPGSKDSLINNFADIYRKGSLNFEVKKVQIDGWDGKEFIFDNDDGEFRVQIFLLSPYMVMNALHSLKKPGLYGADADHYFNSFKVLKDPQVISSSAIEWQTYNYERHGFSIETPIKLKDIETVSKDDQWNSYRFEGMDIPGNIYYGVLVKEVKPGYYSSQDSTYFEETKERVRSNINAVSVSSKHLKYLDFPAFETLLEKKDTSLTMQIKLFMMNRGNRSYFIFASFDPGNSRSIDIERFFSSFQFLPPGLSRWQNQTAPDNSFITWSPAPITSRNDSGSIDSAHYRTYDSVAIITFYVDKDVFSPYYWATSDSILFDEKIKTYTDVNDSVIEYKRLNNDSIQAVDILVRLNNTHNLKKMRLLLNRDTLYSLYSFTSREMIETINSKRFFDDLRITNKVTPAILFENKTELILRDLQSTDSATFSNASNALESATFEKDDLSKLHGALLEAYSDFSSDRYCVHDKIIDIVFSFRDPSTVEFIRQNYEKLQNKKEVLKYPLLRLLTNLKTVESFQLFKNIILTQLPSSGTPAGLAAALKDSIVLTKTLFPAILQLSNDSLFVGVLTSVSNLLLDSNIISIQEVVKYKAAFLSYANIVLNKAKHSDEVNGWEYHDLIYLLGRFNDKESNVLLQHFSRCNNFGFKEPALVMLAKNNQMADPLQVEKVAANKYRRTGFYMQLKKQGKEKLFTQRYLTQKSFAESELFQIASDDYEPSRITYIGERIVDFMGKKQRFFLFKIIYAYDDGSQVAHLGIAGPYSPNPKVMQTDTEATDIMTDLFDLKKIDKQFRQHLLETEKWMKENEIDQQSTLIK